MLLSLRSLVLFGLPLLASSGLAQEQPEPGQRNEPASSAPNQEFQDLLNALPEGSIQAALKGHLLPKFKDGVFQHGRKAVEAVHSADPSLATKLVIVAAKHDLVKRQNNGTSPTVVVPIEIPTTDASGRSATITSSILAPPPTSIGIPITSTDSNGSVLTSSKTVPAILVTSTNSAGSKVVSTSAVPTAGQVLTTTDGKGSTLLTTYSPDADSATSLVLQTSVLPDGSTVTLTSYALAKPTGSKSGSSSQATGQSGSPGLQNDAVKLPGASGIVAALLAGLFTILLI